MIYLGFHLSGLMEPWKYLTFVADNSLVSGMSQFGLSRLVQPKFRGIECSVYLVTEIS